MEQTKQDIRASNAAFGYSRRLSVRRARLPVSQQQSTAVSSQAEYAHGARVAWLGRGVNLPWYSLRRNFGNHNLPLAISSRD